MTADSMTVSLELVRHAGLFGWSALAAHGAGLLVVRSPLAAPRWERLALRSVVGLVVLGTAHFVLGCFGALRAAPLAALWTSAAAVGAWTAWRELRPDGQQPDVPSAPTTTTYSRLSVLIASGALLPLFVLCLYPPQAFDETLYHLPMVRRFVQAGSLPFLAELRMPVAPQLDEVLRVPLLLFGGDTSTHLLSLLATALTAAVVGLAALRLGNSRAVPLAVALALSSPLVVLLATTGYVEALLTLFVVSALFAFARWRATQATGWILIAGLLAGAAAAVKLTGLLWLCGIGLATLWCSWRGDKHPRRLVATLVFAVAALAICAPWYTRMVWFTGNPLFPYGAALFGDHAWSPPERAGGSGVARRLVDVVRVGWDTYFDRRRLNYQPPLSPWLVLALPVVVLAARTDRTTRLLLGLVVGWAILWSLLMPRDPRHLAVILPLAALAAARTLTGSKVLARANPAALALLCTALVLPGPLYAGYRIARLGPPPFSPAAREAFLGRVVPAYPALVVLNGLSTTSDHTLICGGEWLHYYYRGRLFGDVLGPARYERLTDATTTADVTSLLGEFDARFLAIVEPPCTVPAIEAAVAAGSLRRVARIPNLALPARSSRQDPSSAPPLATMTIYEHRTATPHRQHVNQPQVNQPL